ncbi:hypothetical protein Ari01nite_82180 [Paractinoplanes rishiriensis]|uniref:Uncharacterized protein n=1 Tax=Paractinoplanes rishiriensis TaxID=1050105 RepID=A0A919K5Z9_9ACTN|nr:hypothetical protein Ari01nite_82180 [Actinoplanes rishiriensis]
MTLAWSAATPGSFPIAGYDISHNRAFDDIMRLQKVGNVTTVTITEGIRATGNYSFRIMARDTAGGWSTTGSSVSVVTPASDTAADQTPPSRPTGLVAANSPEGIALSWSPSTDDVGVTGYDVYVFDGLWYSALYTTVSGTTATVRPIPAMSSLYVRARDAAGNLSAESNAVRSPNVSSPTPPPSSSPPPAPICSVVYRNSSQWNGGFVAEIQIRNNTGAPIENWTFGFHFGGDQVVQNAWGTGTFTQAGRTVTATPATWTRVIPPNGTVTIGLLGRWTTSNATPTGFTLNGSPCS